MKHSSIIMLTFSWNLISSSFAVLFAFTIFTFLFKDFDFRLSVYFSSSPYGYFLLISSVWILLCNWRISIVSDSIFVLDIWSSLIYSYFCRVLKSFPKYFFINLIKFHFKARWFACSLTFESSLFCDFIILNKGSNLLFWVHFSMRWEKFLPFCIQVNTQTLWLKWLQLKTHFSLREDPIRIPV